MSLFPTSSSPWLWFPTSSSPWLWLPMSSDPSWLLFSARALARAGAEWHLDGCRERGRPPTCLGSLLVGSSAEGATRGESAPPSTRCRGSRRGRAPRTTSGSTSARCPLAGHPRQSVGDATAEIPTAPPAVPISREQRAFVRRPDGGP